MYGCIAPVEDKRLFTSSLLFGRTSTNQDPSTRTSDECLLSGMQSFDVSKRSKISEIFPGSKSVIISNI